MADSIVQLAHDVDLLNSLGIRLVLLKLHGVPPQVEARLNENGAASATSMACASPTPLRFDIIKEATGTVRVEIEALARWVLANTPMAGANMRWPRAIL